MEITTLRCPHCKSKNIKKYGFLNGKQRYACKNRECRHKTFYAKYQYNGCNPAVKRDIIKWSVDGAGIRAIASELDISTDTVISELRKKSDKII